MSTGAKQAGIYQARSQGLSAGRAETLGTSLDIVMAIGPPNCVGFPFYTLCTENKIERPVF